jgi:hypothetical protein
LKRKNVTFESLLRSKKQISYVLCPINIKDVDESSDDSLYFKRQQSVANYVLVRRNHVEQFNDLSAIEKLKFLAENNYLPEMQNQIETDNINVFIENRDRILSNLVNEIWYFN